MSQVPEHIRIVEEVFSRYRSFVYVGKKLLRWDAVGKVAGRAPIFTADFVSRYRDALYVYSVRTKYAHALIKKLDVGEILNYPGVIKVIIARDIPGINDVGYVIPDQPLIADRKVRYVGDVLALVVARDYYIAREAAERIHVEYEKLPVVTNPLDVIDLETLSERKHVLIHDERGSDVVARYRIRRGDVDRGFREADVVVEGEYKTQFQEHAYLEPEAALAVPESDGGVTVIVTTQCPFEARRAIARVLGLPQGLVRVIAPLMGGGFGGKEDVGNVIGAKAALAAYLTGRPAIIIYTREESFISHSKRHPMIALYRHGAKKDGTLVAVEARIVLDTGAYASLGPFVAWRATVHSVGPYRVPNAKVDTVAVYTNNVYAGAFRGFGNPQVHFAVERQMDLLAEELGMDPVDLRFKNILREGDETVHGQLMSKDLGVGLEEALRRAVNLSNWYVKRRKYSAESKGLLRKGIGVAVLWHGNSIGVEGADYSSVSLIINSDGSVTFRTGLTDFGQGALWGLVLIASEILGVPPKYFIIERVDTSAVPNSGPTVASRTTVMGGAATVNAAYKLRQRLNEVASRILGCALSDVEIKVPDVFCRSNPSRKVSWRDIIEEANWLGVPLQEYGYYRAPLAAWDEDTGQGAPYITYTFGAVIAEVTVDVETGEVTVNRIYTVYDVGKVINREGVEHQAESGAIQGLGYALMEELIHDIEGRVVNANLSTYYIPTAADTPEIIYDWVESRYKRGPFGAKGLGEPSLVGIAAAIANAVSHALGVKINELPITPEKVYLILKKSGKLVLDS